MLLLFQRLLLSTYAGQKQKPTFLCKLTSSVDTDHIIPETGCWPNTVTTTTLLQCFLQCERSPSWVQSACQTIPHPHKFHEMRTASTATSLGLQSPQPGPAAGKNLAWRNDMSASGSISPLLASLPAKSHSGRETGWPTFCLLPSLLQALLVC